MLNQRGIAPLLILCFGVILLASISAAYYFGTKNQVKEIPPKAVVINKEDEVSVNAQICSQYGISKDKNKLYKAYTVKKGDTLLSIATNQLKDSSRVGDLIYINRIQYPGLSFENPFIEVGWLLYLPPDYLKQIQLLGDAPQLLYEVSGPIVEVNSDGWSINLDNYNTKYPLKFNKDTQFISKDKVNYKIGDCVVVVMQEQDQKVFTVSPQGD